VGSDVLEETKETHYKETRKKKKKKKRDEENGSSEPLASNPDEEDERSLNTQTIMQEDTATFQMTGLLHPDYADN
jgi:hypothetical protein